MKIIFIVFFFSACLYFSNCESGTEYEPLSCRHEAECVSAHSIPDAAANIATLYTIPDALSGPSVSTAIDTWVSEILATPPEKRKAQLKMGLHLAHVRCAETKKLIADDPKIAFSRDDSLG